MNTDNMVKRLLKQAEEYESTHKRVHLSQREQIVRTLIARFKQEFSREVHIKEKWSSDSVDIQLIAKEITSCDEAPIFRNMISLANVCIIKSHFGKVHYHLIYNFWEWKKIDTL